MSGVWKCSTQGWVKWQSAVFDMRLHPEYCIFYASQINGALTDLFFCVVRINSSRAMDLECDAYKQIEAIVNKSLLSPIM